jgi:hypothetical protein
MVIVSTKMPVSDKIRLSLLYIIYFHFYAQKSHNVLLIKKTKEEIDNNFLLTMKLFCIKRIR